MKILIINTGGTISSVGHPLGPMTAAQFRAAAERLLNPVINEVDPGTLLIYETELVFPTSSNGMLDSTNLQPTDWCRITRFILQRYAEYDGFVILHGTDTMDYTGSALPFLLNTFDPQGFGTAVLSKPVILTGSQLPMFSATAGGSIKPEDLVLNFNTDAFQNFCGAVAAARMGLAEVGVYFDARLYRGSRVLKTDASEFEAFASPNAPALAEFGIVPTLYPEHILPGPVSHRVSLNNPEVCLKVLAQCEAVERRLGACTVMPFSAFPAAYDHDVPSAILADLITACVETGLKGLVLQAYGEGNFPSGNPDHPRHGKIYRALKAATDSGLILVDSTQVIAGTVNYAAYASGAWLPEVGALSAVDMTAVCAVVKLTILISAAEHHGWSPETVKALFQSSLCGEMLSLGRLDSRINPTLLPTQVLVTADASAMLVNDPTLGLRLINRSGSLLWMPVQSAGRLVVQNDGRLVLYNPDNEPVWSAGATRAAGAAMALILDGGADFGTLRLRLVDYAHNETTAVLYDQAQTEPHAPG